MCPAKPWSGVVPPHDVGSFATEADSADRPLNAGGRPAVVVVDMTRAFVDSSHPTGHSEAGWPAVHANAALLQTARSTGHRRGRSRPVGDGNNGSSNAHCASVRS